MKLTTLWEEYKLFYGRLLDLKVLRRSLDELPDNLALTLSFEKNQPGGIIKDGLMTTFPKPQIPKTVAERRVELDRDIQILGARVKQIKVEIIKELERDEL